MPSSAEERDIAVQLTLEMLRRQGVGAVVADQQLRASIVQAAKEMAAQLANG